MGLRFEPGLSLGWYLIMFRIMIVSKNCYLTQMLFKIDRKGTIVNVMTLVFTWDVEVCLQRFQWKPRLSHWRPFCFSVWWFNNIHLTLAALNIWQTHFDMSFIKVNQNPNVYDFTGNGRYMCNSYVVFKPVCFIAATKLASYNSFCRHIGADFNGRFLTGCCCVKTDSIAKRSRPD